MQSLGLIWCIKRKVNRNKIEVDALIQRSILILIWWSDVALSNLILNILCRPILINLHSTVLNLSFSKKTVKSNVSRSFLNILTLIVADWKRISQKYQTHQYTVMRYNLGIITLRNTIDNAITFMSLEASTLSDNIESNYHSVGKSIDLYFSQGLHFSTGWWPRLCPGTVEGSLNYIKYS